jgi:hypothetical protein
MAGLLHQPDEVMALKRIAVVPNPLLEHASTAAFWPSIMTTFAPFPFKTPTTHKTDTMSVSTPCFAAT